jgi:hypothetical protein
LPDGNQPIQTSRSDTPCESAEVGFIEAPVGERLVILVHKLMDFLQPGQTQVTDQASPAHVLVQCRHATQVNANEPRVLEDNVDIGGRRQFEGVGAPVYRARH